MKPRIVFPQSGMLFRHFKGDTYLVLGVALDSDTMGGIVIYRKVSAVKTQISWARSLEDWMKPVDKRNIAQKMRDFILRRPFEPTVRFTYVEKA